MSHLRDLALSGLTCDSGYVDALVRVAQLEGEVARLECENSGLARAYNDLFSQACAAGRGAMAWQELADRELNLVLERRARWRARHKDAYLRLWKLREEAEHYLAQDLFASRNAGVLFVAVVRAIIDEHLEQFLAEPRPRRVRW